MHTHTCFENLIPTNYMKPTDSSLINYMFDFRFSESDIPLLLSVAGTHTSHLRLGLIWRPRKTQPKVTTTDLIITWTISVWIDSEWWKQYSINSLAIVRILWRLNILICFFLTIQLYCMSIMLSFVHVHVWCNKTLNSDLHVFDFLEIGISSQE